MVRGNGGGPTGGAFALVNQEILVYGHESKPKIPFWGWFPPLSLQAFTGVLGF